MDTLKCNILACRSSLTDKAVVRRNRPPARTYFALSVPTHNSMTQACETSLTEPDDVVVCSLHPTNDYKTSVLSGLNPVIVLEICSRAMSFWQYQMHQELSFQQTVLRTINDKSAYLQKELDNAVREARGQISLLNNKLSDVERDLDLERKRATSLQDAMKDREKEYQKLKVQYDKIKRKALLTPGTLGQNMNEPMQISHAGGPDRIESHSFNNFPHHRGDGSTPVDVGAVVGDMNANGVQRTPIVTRNNMVSGSNRLGRLPAGTQMQSHQSFATGYNKHQRHGDNQRTDRHHPAPPTTVSDRSEEDENFQGRQPGRSSNSWTSGNRPVQKERPGGFGPPRRSYSKFKPAQ